LQEHHQGEHRRKWRTEQIWCQFFNWFCVVGDVPHTSYLMAFVASNWTSEDLHKTHQRNQNVLLFWVGDGLQEGRVLLRQFQQFRSMGIPFLKHHSMG
jgi:hypothetical protein